MAYKEVVPRNYNNLSKTQRDVLYALGDKLYTTERVAKRQESVGKAQIVTPRELQIKTKEYFGRQPKGVTDYPDDENKNYRIFSATPEGVKAAEDYVNSPVEKRRESDAKWLDNTHKLFDKMAERGDIVYHKDGTPWSDSLKICAFQAAQNEVSEESQKATQKYLFDKNVKKVTAKAAEQKAAAEKASEGPEME